MRMLDLTRDDGHQALDDCDICIVGSGPAGTTLAQELSGTKFRVTLLESGLLERSNAADELNDLENIGHPRLVDQWFVRNRIFGGSSHTWGGRCAPFDNEDFAARSWVDHSGWPIDLKELNPYLQRSANYLGLGCGYWDADEIFEKTVNKSSPLAQINKNWLEPFFWQYSRNKLEKYPFEYTRFGDQMKTGLSENVTVVIDATAIHINPTLEGTAVKSVTYVNQAGKKRVLTAKKIVLSAGGIENPRILLASNSVVSAGLGNGQDLVGRFFMDHLRGPVGEYDKRHAKILQQRMGRYIIGRNLYRAGFRLSAAIQQREGLLNTAAWINETVAADDPWNELRNFMIHRTLSSRRFAILLRNLPLIISGLRGYRKGIGFPRRVSSISLDCMSEQQPNFYSRITLSEKTDRNMVPLAAIKWKISDDERRSVVRLARLIADQSTDLQLPPIKLHNWVLRDEAMPGSFTDVAHPSGTTKMSIDATSGVVDCNLQVHGIDGLFVTGSSTFPTISHCNPTQMIVALAIRLADHLKTNV